MPDTTLSLTLAGLLDHLSCLPDPRQDWRVVYPLPELLLLVICGTVAGCDDYEDICEWGRSQIAFLRRMHPFHHGVPSADWLRALVQRIDADAFSACFMNWIRHVPRRCAPLIAIDGKVARRSHAPGRPALRMVSAFAAQDGLVLGQEAVPRHGSEQVTIPVLLHRLASHGLLQGSLVSIDAAACTPAIAQAIIAGGADYVLSVKGNQPRLRDAIADAIAQNTTGMACSTERQHGRREHRECRTADMPEGQNHFPQPRTVARIDTRIERSSHRSLEQRFYISSARLCPRTFAAAVRGRWTIENKLHWILDMLFRDDWSRLRRHGARNMTIIRHIAVNLLRLLDDGRSLKRRRKMAAWQTDYLSALIAR